VDSLSELLALPARRRGNTLIRRLKQQQAAA
jgi:hypothetical protein